MNASVVRRGAFVLFVFAAVPSVERLVVASQTPVVVPPSSQGQAVIPPAMNTPEESAAYAAANALKDPKAKLEALRKFQADFPGRSLAKAADASVLAILLTNYKDRTEEIRTTLDAAVANLPATSAPEIKLARIQSWATQLLDAASCRRCGRRSPFAGNCLSSQ